MLFRSLGDFFMSHLSVGKSVTLFYFKLLSGFQRLAHFHCPCAVKSSTLLALKQAYYYPYICSLNWKIGGVTYTGSAITQSSRKMPRVYNASNVFLVAETDFANNATSLVLANLTTSPLLGMNVSVLYHNNTTNILYADGHARNEASCAELYDQTHISPDRP